MTERAFSYAKKIGYTAVFLCGDPEIYRKLGFIPTFEYKIYHVTDKEKNAEWCMAYELIDGALSGITGTIDIL